jgi:hypothetical protein
MISGSSKREVDQAGQRLGRYPFPKIARSRTVVASGAQTSLALDPVKSSGRHVDGLNGRDRAAFGECNAFLHMSVCQCWLVANGGRDTTTAPKPPEPACVKRKMLSTRRTKRPSLCRLRNCSAKERPVREYAYAQARSSGRRPVQSWILQGYRVINTNHLVVQIVAFTSPLTRGKHGGHQEWTLRCC